MVRRLERSVYDAAPPAPAALLDRLAAEIEVERDALRPQLGPAGRGAFRRCEADRLTWEEILLQRSAILERCATSAKQKAEVLLLVLKHCDPAQRLAFEWMLRFHAAGAVLSKSDERRLQRMQESGSKGGKKSAETRRKTALNHSLVKAEQDKLIAVGWNKRDTTARLASKFGVAEKTIRNALRSIERT